MTKFIKTKNTMDMDGKEFRDYGSFLVEKIAQFIETLPDKKVSPGKNPSEIKALLSTIEFNNEGTEVKSLLDEAANLLFENSLFNGHPRFWGYITSSAAPIGALADMLASSVNANVGAFYLSPMATEIERQTIRWIAEFIGYDDTAEGLFVSGGNMANFLGLLTARRQKFPDIRKNGHYVMSIKHDYIKIEDTETLVAGSKLMIYCARETHTWIQKAADLFGFGTDALRWIDHNDSLTIDTQKLVQQIELDKKQGHVPFIIIGNAGTVGTGTVDNLKALASISQAHDLWLHVDGAYGGPAAGLSEFKELFNGIDAADSIALDPHKWLYSPIEAGCILLKNKGNLQNAFSYSPEYYNFDGSEEDQPLNYHEFGMQNSRGFKALKVWLSLRQVGKNGLEGMIRRDVELSNALHQLVKKSEYLEPFTQNLSITTFRFVPKSPSENLGNDYLNGLNKSLVDSLQKGGEVYLSNAMVNDCYCLRVCIVNFRTQYSDLLALIELVIKEGNELHEVQNNRKTTSNRIPGVLTNLF